MLISELEEKVTDAGGGVFALDKPKGVTSQRAVQIVKYWARDVTGNRKIKVGHGGTLDPLATGILVIAIGRAYTKQIDTFVKAEKEYSATVKLGETSTTDDAEGQKSHKNVESTPSIENVQNILNKFIGEIEQVPPAYSAIKIDGQEAYKRVRRGEAVEMKPRRVQIAEIEVLKYDYPHLEIHVECGKGTYIRSLARDIGTELKTGAYLADLKRTRVGVFQINTALDINTFE